jgi:hypothetical protein
VNNAHREYRATAKRWLRRLGEGDLVRAVWD